MSSTDGIAAILNNSDNENTENGKTEKRSNRKASRSEVAKCARRLFVKKHEDGRKWSREQLIKMLEPFGKPAQVEVTHRGDTAYVTMETKEGADKAQQGLGKHPDIIKIEVAKPRNSSGYFDREYNRDNRGNSKHSKYKRYGKSDRKGRHYSDRDSSWNSNDSWNGNKSWRQKNKRKGRYSDFKPFQKRDKRRSENNATSPNPTATVSVNANAYPADENNGQKLNQLGQQFSQMNLNAGQQVPHGYPMAQMNYENTQNMLAMSQMSPVQQQMYNQYLLGLYGMNMCEQQAQIGMGVDPQQATQMNMNDPQQQINPNQAAAQMEAQAQMYNQAMFDPQQAQQAQHMYDAHQLFQFYQPPYPFFLPFPQISENPYGLVQLQGQEQTPNDVQAGIAFKDTTTNFQQSAATGENKTNI